MSTQTDKTREPRSLEEELQELAADEKELKLRLEKTPIAALLTAFIALLVSIVAVVVALSNKSDHTTVVERMSAPNGGSAMGGGMTGGRTAATSRTINVQLGEMWVRPSATSITAGKVTFIAHNGGQVKHELMVERMPLKMDGPGRPTEDAAQGMIEDMMPGRSGRMTLNLKPGTYMLFCNVPGHYAAGQHTTFTVTQ